MSPISLLFVLHIHPIFSIYTKKYCLICVCSIKKKFWKEKKSLGYDRG